MLKSTDSSALTRQDIFYAGTHGVENSPIMSLLQFMAKGSPAVFRISPVKIDLALSHDSQYKRIARDLQMGKRVVPGREVPPPVSSTKRKNRLLVCQTK